MKYIDLKQEKFSKCNVFGSVGKAASLCCILLMICVNLNAQLDQPPQLNCPATTTITLDPGDCDHTYNFIVTATDDIDPNPVITQMAGPPSGSSLVEGTTTLFQFQAMDNGGNVSTCSWSVTIEEYQNPSGTIACNDLANISLDLNCTAIVGADDILEGGPYGCYAHYTVSIIDQFGNNIGNTVNGTHIGQTLPATVTSPSNGNSCTGNIFIEDKYIPTLSCSNYNLLCSDNTAPSAFNDPGFPLPPGVTILPDPTAPGYDVNYTGPWTIIGFDACGTVTLSFSDQSTTNQCQVINKAISRTWTAVDESGNATSCTETINLLRQTLTDVTPPPNFDGIDEPALNCEERKDPNNVLPCGPANVGWNVLPAGHPYAGHPSPDDELYSGCAIPTVKWFGTGYPGNFDCGDIRATFQDTRINICSNGSSEGCYKILRHWVMLDWCTGGVRNFDQTIKVEDTEGPTIADIADITISTDPWRCAADWIATTAWLSDNCGSDPLAYTISSTGGIVDQIPGGAWRVRDLVPGVYTITYTASDCCGNESEELVRLTVVDDSPPVAACDQHTVVSISSTSNGDDPHLGLTKIFAETFDDGSHDNCSNQLWFKVIRMDEFDSNGNDKTPETVQQGDWETFTCNDANGDDDPRVNPPWYLGPQSYFDDYVKFCCEDIQNGPIMVVFRVFDKDPRPYEAGNFLNNGNSTGVLPEAMSSNDWFGGPGPLYNHFNDCMVEVTVQDKLPPNVVAPPNLTVTCDFWFPFDPDNPNDYTDDFDGIFGKVVEGTANPAHRDSINILDRVCPVHPRFNEFAPASQLDDPCYDTQYRIFWGRDGYALSNCDLDLQQEIIPNLHCGRGNIIRRWMASDGSGNMSNLASQIITIIDCKEFYVPTACWRFTPRDVGECDLVNLPGGLQYRNKLIEWPCDIELSRCQGPIDEVFKPENLDVFFDEDRRPRLDDDNCSLLAATYEDQAFTFVDSSCIKIFRTWHVIDWCLYEDFQAGLYNGPYEWDWEQVIKLLNTVGPTFDNCSQTVCGYGNPGAPGAAQCVGEVTIDPGISDDCSKLEDLRIDYKFDYYNDGEYDELGYSDNYGNNYPFPNPNGLPVNRFAAVNYPISGFYPVGTHRLLWAAEDGCGNFNICEYFLTIEDCKPPTPYCQVGVSTIPMPPNAGGYIDIWASDFDINSEDNCTAKDDLRFSFSDDPNDQSIRLTCVMAGTGVPIDLTVYVWDEAGNYATCAVSVLLTDCQNQTYFSISGNVYNEEDEMVEYVMMRLNGGLEQEQMTTADGSFDFQGLPENLNYSLIPEKDMNPLNGVSTFDLVLISKHILGVQALGSPYKMIAADINNSGTITTFDIVELRKLILFIKTDFTNNTSWRFVEAGFSFPDPAAPFSATFPELYSVNGLTDHQQVDFMAIKTGDVNCSAQPNQLMSSDGRGAKESMSLQMKDELLVAGERYQIPWLAKDFREMEGFQFALQFDKAAVSIESIQTGELAHLNDNNFGLALVNKGVITSSWSDSRPHSLEDGAVVFSVTIKALQTTQLSDVLHLSADYLAAEAYRADGSFRQLQLEFVSPSAVQPLADFALHQNRPNPFKNHTTFSFVLREAGAATLTVYDLTGRVIWQHIGHFQQGYNELDISGQSLEAAGAGVLYYRLETDQYSATRKMLIID